MDTSEDTELWLAFQQGDEEAYAAIYRLHIRPMYRYGMSLVPASEAFVLDSIHDVFAEIWIKRARLTKPDNVRHYLLKALKVRVMHQLRREERPHRNIHQLDFDDLWTEPSVEEILVQTEESSNRQELMKKLIGQLPPRQQEAIRLRFVEELDYTEIGEVLNINRQSAQNLVFRAVEKLRSWFQSPILIFSSFFWFC